MSSNNAIDTAARFGDIPFVDFTKGLVTGVFDSLVESHIEQMEAYATFVNSLTDDLSTYINNTQDGITFDQISDFILEYDLPEVDNDALVTVLELLEAPSDNPVAAANPIQGQPATTETWWGGLINGLAPAVSGLVDKLNDPSENLAIQALDNYNNDVLSTAGEVVVPTYKQIHDSIAALIASNKYGLLQTMAKQGVMRLVVTEGEIETKITFSTWNNSTRGSSTSSSTKEKSKEKIKIRNKQKRGIFRRIFKGKNNTRTKSRSSSRVITVNTAKSYQRDSSGTKVDIFGRVLIKFKTDYAPLNG